MASSSSNANENANADPSPTAITTISLAGASPARPVASAPQAQPLSQFIQRHHQLQHTLQHSTNQQRVFTGTGTGTGTGTAQSQTHSQSGKGSESVLYPLASSGRGLLPTPPLGGFRAQLPEQKVTVANPGLYPLPTRSIVAHGRLFASSDSPHPPHSGYPLRPPYLHPSHVHMSSVSPPPPPAGIRGISVTCQPQSKVPSSTCFAPDSNGHEDPMRKGTDNIFVSVRDRKVRIPDGSSIYALCRSWLRNGYPEESQLQYGDFVKSLPKPSPTPMSESSLAKRKEIDDEIETEEDEKSSENLSAKQLLQRHIKRAKRVRARLREERLQRIARYKSRLALLLPPVMEQCGNDTNTGT